MKAIMTGNEAVARGAWEGGLVFASAYRWNTQHRNT